MKKGKKFVLYAVSAVVIVGGLIVGYNVKHTSNAVYNQAEESAYMTSYMEFVQKGGTPVEVEKRLQEGLGHLRKEVASDAVDGLFYSIFQTLPELSKKADGLESSITKYAKQNIDFSKSADVAKIDDPTLRAFIGEVNANHAVIVFEAEHYVVNPNIKQLVSTYSEYMSDPMLAMARFYEKEYEEPFFDSKNQKFDYDKIVERILMLEDDLKKYPNSSYDDWFRTSKVYYYKIYFAKDNDVLLDSEKRLISELRDHYEKTIKDHPDSQLAKDLKEYVSKLKTSDYQITDDIAVYLLDLTQTSSSASQAQGSGQSTQSTQTNSSTTSTTNGTDPLQDALKANGK